MFLKEKKNFNPFIKNPLFWILVFFSCVLISFIAVNSLMIASITFLVLIMIPIFWKVVANQKSTLVLILLSIVPGMLGRFTLSPKGGTAILLTDLFVVALVFGYFFRKILSDKKWHITKLHYAIGMFFLIALISFLNGFIHLYDLGQIKFMEIFTAFLYLIRWVGYAGIFFVLCDEIKSFRNISNWFKILMWICLFTTILGFLQLIIYPDFFVMFVKYGWDPHKDRLLGTFFDPNLIGAFFALNICVLLGVLLHIKKHKKLLWLLFIAMLIALFLTLSRSGYVALIGGFFVISLLKSRKLLLIGILVIILGVALNPRVFDRISQGVSMDDSASKHMDSWIDGIHIIRSYPLLGVGYNMLPSVYDDLALVNEWDIHNRSGIENSIFTVWVTTGLFGVISYMLIGIIAITTAYTNWKNKNLPEKIRGLNLGILGGIFALILSSMFVNVLLFSYIVVYLWFYFAFIMKSNTSILAK